MAVSLSYKTPDIHHIRDTLTAQTKDFHRLKSQEFEDWHLPRSIPLGYVHVFTYQENE